MKFHAEQSLSARSRLLLMTAVGVSFVWPLTAGVWSASAQQAQSPPAAGSPAFEVASVKANKSGDGRVMFGMQPGGRYTATNVPLRLLIQNAYQLQDFQLVGGPAWIASERFDIIAKAEGNPPPPSPGGPPGPMQLMLRALLAERFGLAVHQETRELPIYALVQARNDGKLGSHLRPAAVDCGAAMAAARTSGGPPPAPPQPGERPTCGIRIGPGQVSGGGMPLSQLATILSRFAQRVVIDHTGLAGSFDFDLAWLPEQLPQGPPPPGAPPPPPIDPNGPSLFTAVQEQLGLKLDAQRGPVEVLVIDKVEQPMPD